MSDDKAIVPIIEAKQEELKAVQTELRRLEVVLSRSFTPEKIHDMLSDLCNANDLRMSKDGEVMFTPNWDARKNGLDRVLKLLKYTNKNDDVQGTLVPTTIIFNVVNESPKQQ